MPEIGFLNLIISFSATSGVYMFMLKSNFWKASLILIVEYAVLLILVFLVALLFGVLGMILS